jgi:hypothetical protein
MNKIKTGRFTPDGSTDIAVPIGFIPDYIRFEEVGEATSPNVITWFRMQESDATGDQAGQYITGTTGVITKLADGAGVAAYSTGAEAPTVTTWTKAVGDAATARTATAAGTYVKPSVASDADRGSIFECVTAGTSDATEPIWPDADGEQITDGSTVWEKVNVSKQRGGYQGVLIDAAILTDGEEMYYIAYQANQSVNHGDTDGWNSGVDPNA